MDRIEQELEQVERQVLKDVALAPDGPALERVRVGVLGKKGALTRLLRGLSELPAEQRPRVGQRVNRVKQRIVGALSVRRGELAEAERSARLEAPQLDVTLPAWGQGPGHVHPLSRTMEEVCGVLSSLGFSTVEGPEIEDDYHNFEALNIPSDHPAREMQDTFFVEGGLLLRTHTSPVQIRVMETRSPPFMIMAPGAVYRHDDDVTHSPMFHQVEGLLVDHDIRFSHLKYVLTEFLRGVFGTRCRVRFRPSYFPFTEPSAEVDIGCVLCNERGDGARDDCRVCKGTGWLEILGAGMVHPAVFEQVGYDPQLFSGFAFGLGVERIAMLKYGISDIRLFYTNDLRFLEQF